MTRSILAGVAAAVALVAVSGTGCQPTGVGDPCTPEAEYATSFTGFSSQEVSTESADYQCFSRLCLVNHFQGRVTCPYGQDPSGNPPPGASDGCKTPYIKAAVTGNGPNGQPLDPTNKALVKPQCLDRTADKAVYCSCRCANLNGGTDDGAVYCTCPDGFSCTQVYSSIGGGGNQGLTGAYCLKSGTEYPTGGVGVCAGQCDATQGNCGSAQGVHGM